MAIKNFLSGGRELSQISKSTDVRDLKTWVASLFNKTIDAVNQTNQAAVSSNEVTGGAAQVLATPPSSSGTATPTTLTSAYLPAATADAIGAVKPDGTTITVGAGGVLSATEAAPPSGPGNQVFATPNGSAGDAEIRALVPADLPVATTSALGAVKPDGTTITITDGVITSVGGSGGTVLFGSGPPASGPEVVQSTSGGGYGLSFSSPVTSGNLLLVAYKSEGTITGVTISDTLGTSYTLVASISGQPNNLNVYAGIAPASGANTVTIGGAPNNYDRLGLMEVYGVGVTVDATASSYNGSSPYSLAITTTNATDFIFAAVAGYHNVNTFAFSAPFTLDSQSNGSDANAIGHYLTTSAGTFTLTVTLGAGAADNQPAILIAFKTAVTPPTDGTFYFDTSTDPYTGYVYNGAWEQLGGGTGTVPLAISQTPDWPPASPTPYDDEFTEGSLNASLWTNVVNGRPNTITVSNSMLQINCPGVGGDNFTSIAQPVPSGNWSFATKMSISGSNYNYWYAGLTVMDSGGRLAQCAMQNAPFLVLNYWFSNTSYSGNDATLAIPYMIIYLRCDYDGTNLTWSYSQDGASGSWVVYETVSATSFLANVSYIGVSAGTNNKQLNVSFDWFRRLA